MTKTLSPMAQDFFWTFNSEFKWIEDGVPGPQFDAIAAILFRVAEYDLTNAQLIALATELQEVSAS